MWLAVKGVLKVIIRSSASPKFAIGKPEQTSLDTKDVIFTINEFCESKSADGLNRSYKLESVYRPLQVCETQTCVKNVLGFLGVHP